MNKLRIAAIMANAGLTCMVMIAAGYYGGNYLDTKLGTPPYLMMVGICLGLGLGMWWIILTANKNKL